MNRGGVPAREARQGCGLCAYQDEECGDQCCGQMSFNPTAKFEQAFVERKDAEYS